MQDLSVRHERPRPLLTAIFIASVGFGASGVAVAGQWGQLPDPAGQTAFGWLQNCLIYATDSVVAGGLIRNNPGPNDPATFRSDVCSAKTVSIGGATWALVPEGAPTLYDVALAAPTINLERYSRSSDCVYDSATGSGVVVGTSPVVVCPSQQDASLTNMPANAAALDAVLPFPIFTPGASPADDIEVPANTILELSPGAYGRIVLNLNARLVLKSAGNYNVLSIATKGIKGEETRAYIDVESENVNLNVEEYLALGHRSRVNQAGTRLFRIYVKGGDNNTIDTWYADVTGFDFRGDGTFNACFVYSPEATQTWRGRPYLQTAFKTQAFAKNFAQNFRDKLLVRFEHPQDPECFEILPEYVCATIGRLVPPGVTCDSASGIVSLPAWNASETSLSYVGLIREDALLPLAPTVRQFIDASCVMFPSGDPSIPVLPGVDPNPVIYSPPGAVENVIQTPDIWAAGVLSAKPGCPDNPDDRLVPFALGPIVEDNVDRPPVCFSAATFQFLEAVAPETCTMVDP